MKATKTKQTPDYEIENWKQQERDKHHNMKMKIDETFNKYFQGCTARLPDHQEPIANLQNVCKLKLRSPNIFVFFFWYFKHVEEQDLAHIFSCP